jgi:LPS O-antigen subunit length determinant protein (WzzB/FepE family)
MTDIENTNSNSDLQDAPLELKELFSILWKGKILIIVIAAVFFVVAAIYALSLPNLYRSSTSMSVINMGAGANTITTQINFSGLSVQEKGVKGPRYVNTVRSRAFFKHLIEVDEDFLPALMAAKRYHKESEKLIYNSDVYDAVNKKWLVEKPHYLDAYDFYRGKVTIVYHQERSIIDISIEHISPVAARDMVESIMYKADQMLRDFDLEASSEALAYLTTAIPKQQQIALRSAMNDMIMNQLETQMMTKIGPTYIIQVVDPPFVPLYRFAPNRTFISLSAGVVGLIFGIIFILMRHFLPTLRKLASGS